MGLSTGIMLLQQKPNLKVLIVEKEPKIAIHSSGRNSGVLHSGFYYSPESLKAKFCKEGNLELRELAKKYSVPIRNVGKIVVAKDFEELGRLEKLYQRGIDNGIDLEIHKAEILRQYEPLASTFGKFLWSPTTGVSDPIAISDAMRQEFEKLGGRIVFNEHIALRIKNNEIRESTDKYEAKYFINASGSQADRISGAVGVGKEFVMVPFMGIYRATKEMYLPLRHLVYPVPHPINPFLGVHFTLTIDNKVKIGPTAIPVFGREQYSIIAGWSRRDTLESLKGIASLVKGNSHSVRDIFKSECPKLNQSRLIEECSNLVPSVAEVRHWERKPPGIRSQLVHLPSGKLEQDFIVKSNLNATHILNAVSPGWTSALPFGRWVANQVLN